jgi:hypothetical protein
MSFTHVSDVFDCLFVAQPGPLGNKYSLAQLTILWEVTNFLSHEISFWLDCALQLWYSCTISHSFLLKFKVSLLVMSCLWHVDIKEVDEEIVGIIIELPVSWYELPVNMNYRLV